MFNQCSASISSSSSCSPSLLDPIEDERARTSISGFGVSGGPKSAWSCDVNVGGATEREEEGEGDGGGGGVRGCGRRIGGRASGVSDRCRVDCVGDESEAGVRKASLS